MKINLTSKVKSLQNITNLLPLILTKIVLLIQKKKDKLIKRNQKNKQLQILAFKIMIKFNQRETLFIDIQEEKENNLTDMESGQL